MDEPRKFGEAVRETAGKLTQQARIVVVRAEDLTKELLTNSHGLDARQELLRDKLIAAVAEWRKHDAELVEALTKEKAQDARD